MENTYIIPELKSCPFCGGDGKIHDALGDYFMGGRTIIGKFIQCSNCGVKTESFTYSKYDFTVDCNKLLAIRAWNQRPNEGTFSCPECGVDVPHRHIPTENAFTGKGFIIQLSGSEKV